MRAIAIDFETANEQRASPCAVVLAWIENGSVTRTAYRLIRPPEMRFAYGNIRVHGIRPVWQILRDAGIAAPIDSEILYYVLIGAASLPYVNAPEVRLLTGRDPKSPSWIEAHANGLVAILLPGLAAGTN